MKRHARFFVTTFLLVVCCFVTADGGDRLVAEKSKPAARIDAPGQTATTDQVLSTQAEGEPIDDTQIYQQPIQWGPREQQASYAIPRKTINGGGGHSANADFSARVSIGQHCIGRIASAEHSAGIGFWHGQGAAMCDCGFPGDVDCDGVTTPVDVIFLANYVYQQRDDRCLRPNCPYESGDFDCEFHVTPVDVILLVNHVYRLQPIETLCDGCAP